MPKIHQRILLKKRKALYCNPAATVALAFDALRISYSKTFLSRSLLLPRAQQGEEREHEEKTVTKTSDDHNGKRIRENVEGLWVKTCKTARETHCFWEKVEDFGRKLEDFCALVVGARGAHCS